MPADCNLPALVIHGRDNNDLVVFATIAHRLGNPDAEFLLAELRRAELCAGEALPDDVVATRFARRLQAGRGPAVQDRDADIS
jgi:hypothetical protein